MRETASLPTCRRRAWRTRNPFGRSAFAVDGPADRHGAGAGSGKSSSTSPGTSHRRDRHSGPPRSPAVEPLSHPGGRGARHYLDSRRARGDAGGLARRRPEGEPGAAILQYRRRTGSERLSRRRGSRRAVLRLAHRPARPQEALLHHALGLSRRHRCDRAVLEFLELCVVPICDRRRHRRRVCGDQLDNPGADPGAGSRLDRPRHQRQLLDRRGARRVRSDRAARSGRHRPRIRLAGGLPDRRAAGAGDLFHAAVAAGEPALADDPRPCRGGRTGGGSIEQRVFADNRRPIPEKLTPVRLLRAHSHATGARCLRPWFICTAAARWSASR